MTTGDLGARWAVIFLLVAGATSQACSGSNGPQDSKDGPVPQKYAAFAAAFDQERQQLGVSGASVALLENGQVTFAHGFGTKGPNSDAPVDAETLFRVGSMTKALTATALLGLVQAGTVDLDATLLSVVPDVAIDDAGNLGALTIRQLLSHQSGLFDYGVVDGPADDASLSQFLTSPAFAANEYFMDPPGTFYNYANPNFSLAGLALERAGGVSYRQAIADRVLSPLGMTRTFFLPSDVIADGDFTDGASTTSTGAPWDVTPDAYDNAWLRPAGYAFSSVLDYAKFVQFLYAGNAAVLADGTRAMMETPQVDMLDIGGAQADIESYGFGLVIDREFQVGESFYVTKLVWHNGSLPGFMSWFYLVPSTGFGIVWLANADGVTFSKSVALALQSFAGLTEPTTQAPAGVAVDPSLFPSYAGNYDDPNGLGPITVTASGSTLSIDVPSFDAAGTPYEKTLQPTSMDNFIITVQGSPVLLTFIPDATGTYVWIRTQTVVARRVPSDAGTTP
ncbi:MAG TPA: serine hydrolase domain-containing protein [Polyangia bacterium]|nr:serine hydrolase domain-containing protein [Polyangia bacterium]